MLASARRGPDDMAHMFALTLARRRRRAAARALYEAARAQSRRPELYAAGGVADTVQGRTDALMLHVQLLLRRLRGAGADAHRMAQAVFAELFADLESALWEMGLSEMELVRRMRRLGEDYAGRAAAYDVALEAGDMDALADAISRNLLAAGGQPPSPAAHALAGYAAICARALETAPILGLLAGAVPALPGPPRWGAGATADGIGAAI